MKLIEDFDAFELKTVARFEELQKEGSDVEKKRVGSTSTEKSSYITKDVPRECPSTDTHITTTIPISEILEYINPQALYCTHFGIKGIYTTLLENKDERLLKLMSQIDEVKKYIIDEDLLSPRALYRYFPCNAEGNSIHIQNSKGEVIETFTFPRQSDDDKLCVSDFISHNKDSIALFVTTCGEGVAQKAQELREKGEYVKSHMLQVIALEAAEAYAELIHERVRQEWGIETEELSKRDLFRTRYQGIRLSFGYPACPSMEDQKKLFKLLSPDKIGVQLTENLMMDPEASVSAIVLHHPQGKYFSVD